MTFRILQYLLRKRKAVWAFTLAVAVIALAVVLIADAPYRSEALLMPPLEEGSEGLLGAWMAQLNLPSMVIPMSAGSQTAAITVDILQSRRLAEIVIDRLDLKAWYKTESMHKAVDNLQDAMSIQASTTGMISMKVTDRDPEMALRIASECINGLDSLNHFLQFTRAGNTMSFVGGQIEKYRARLVESRREMAEFQTRHGIVDFDAQIKGAIEVAAGLKVKAALAEIELELLRDFATRDALELKRMEAEFKGLNDQLRNMAYGDSAAAVFIPLLRMPGLTQEYASLRRDLDVNEKVYSFLMQRYEESGIDRARNTPSIQVVDIPRLPDRRAGLQPWAIVLLAALAGFIWICLVLAWWGWLSLREREDGEEKAFRGVVDLVGADLKSLRRFLRI
ncbi:MAG: Wzz/FepE/Etk N-terminal domain-containing protein [Candidatus Krumholzibacteria bacterium]|jgi:uncharacterized protein involved in exopolysaccharide biosynthesis|nr:Wzz/FepE/Etk N-terminal domain-containing protein [Candidatus Krumholzibacteria bacterium]